MSRGVLEMVDDMYRGLSPIPSHLTTTEFNLRMDQRLLAYRTLRDRVEKLMAAARAALAACEPETPHEPV